MPGLDVTIEARELDRMVQWVASLSGNLDLMTAKAMTYAAKDAQKLLRQRTPSYVTSPTRWTLNSTFVLPATPANLSVTLGFKDWASKGTPAAKYLQPIVGGGVRRAKSTERQLQRAGLISSRQFLVPTGVFPLKFDSKGNLSGGSYTQVLSRLRALGEQGYAGNASGSQRSTGKRASRDYFIGEAQGKRGIQARVGPKPTGKGGKGSAKGGRPMTAGLARGFHTVFNIVDQAPKYRPQFPARQIMNNEFNSKFPSIFERLVFKMSRN